MLPLATLVILFNPQTLVWGRDRGYKWHGGITRFLYPTSLISSQQIHFPSTSECTSPLTSHSPLYSLSLCSLASTPHPNTILTRRLHRRRLRRPPLIIGGHLSKLVTAFLIARAALWRPGVNEGHTSKFVDVESFSVEVL